MHVSCWTLVHIQSSNCSVFRLRRSAVAQVKGAIAVAHPYFHGSGAVVPSTAPVLCKYRYRTLLESQCRAPRPRTPPAWREDRNAVARLERLPLQEPPRVHQRPGLLQLHSVPLRLNPSGPVLTGATRGKPEGQAAQPRSLGEQPLQRAALARPGEVVTPDRSRFGPVLTRPTPRMPRRASRRPFRTSRPCSSAPLSTPQQALRSEG